VQDTVRGKSHWRRRKGKPLKDVCIEDIQRRRGTVTGEISLKRAAKKDSREGESSKRAGMPGIGKKEEQGELGGLGDSQ